MVKIFSKDGCPYCDKAKMLLDNYEIDYVVENVTHNKESLAFIKGNGHTTVPQIYNNSDILVEGGYDGLAALSREEILERLA